VLGHLGIYTASVHPGIDVLTPQRGPLVFVGGSNPNVPVRDVDRLDVAAYSSAPRSLISPSAIDRHGWESVPAAWLVEAREPLTGDQLAEARDQAWEAGVTVEARRGQEGLSQLRSAATAVGFVLALGIVSMTVALVHSEAAADLRTLAAVGASRWMRRAVTALTAGALALLGSVLGTAGAYAGLSAGYADDLGALLPVPVLNLVTVTVGLPVVAAAAARLLGGGSNQPSALARNPLE
jgi:putative ABC transport system permease protein